MLFDHKKHLETITSGKSTFNLVVSVADLEIGSVLVLRSRAVKAPLLRFVLISYLVLIKNLLNLRF